MNDDDLEKYLATLHPVHAITMVLLVCLVAIGFGVTRVLTAPWRWCRR